MYVKVDIPVSVMPDGLIDRVMGFEEYLEAG